MKMFGSSGKKPNNNRHYSDEYYEPERPTQQYYEEEPSEYDDGYGVNEYGESDEEINAAIYAYRARRKKKRRTALIVILAVVALLAAAYFIFIRAPKINDEGLAQTGKVTDTPAIDSDALGGSQAPDATPVVTEEEVVYEDTGVGRKSYCFTFVALGEDKESKKTDTIIVGMMDVKNHTINCVSLPRDTLVNVSWGTKKINSLYYGTDGVGDVQRLLDGVKNLFGYTIDQYAVINLEAFEVLVDAVGGIYYDVPFDMKYYDPAQDLDINIPAGYQLLDGATALKVVRFRQGINGENSYPMGDIGRIGTQQDFLMTAAKQMLTLGNIPNLTSAAKVFEEYVDTTLSAGNIVWYAKEFLKVKSEDIHFMTLPGNYSLAVGKNKTSYVEIYPDEWVEMLNTYFNPYHEQISLDNLNLLFYNPADGSMYSNTGTVAGGPYSYSGAQ